MQAVVDIDNTLWDFASVLYEKLKAINPSVPPPSYWTAWDFFKNYVSEFYFYQLIEEIHKKQDEYGVYPEAKKFLDELKDLGFRVIIASHRAKKTENSTVRWLRKHNLHFDELHLSYDKSVLFPSSDIVIDDSPFVLEKAKTLGIMALGIEYPWNKANGFLLFKNLTEILSYIKEHFEL